MKVPDTNLRVIAKRTRKPPKLGDIFVYQIDPFSERYYFGRVIATDTRIGNIENVLMLYFYKELSDEKKNIPPLKCGNLLIPPVGSNAQPWYRGYFENVGSIDTVPLDILSQHCFRDYIPGFVDKFVDEYGKPFARPIEPVGIYGLSGLGAIDEKISEALGISLREN